MTWDSFPEMAGIIKDFVSEGVEGLDRLDLELIALENDPSNAELLASVLRTVHSLKGTSGVLGFVKLERLLHRGEDLLTRIRAGTASLGIQEVSALLSMFDKARELLGAIEAEGAEGEISELEAVAALEALLGRETEPGAGPAHAPASLPETTDLTLKDEPEGWSGGEGLGISEGTVRIDVELLDRLMDQVGELVLARNRVQLLASALQDQHLFAASQRLGVITTELQEGVMKTRMQPITTLWNRLPRMVRDVSHLVHKEVRLVTTGGDTELDRTVLEAFSDPLMHLVRNAIDHGIETPAARLAMGKPAEGVLQLRSYHEGGYVHIEVSDDGAGLNTAKIVDRALELGVVASETVAHLTDRERNQLIFMPGLSTAAQVTSVSGRGVGLDVVKTNIERIGGSLEVFSVPAQGTTFRVRIPLTLAIIPALMVACGEETYAIPQVSLLELVTLAPDDPGLEDINGTPVYRLRDQLLALVDLRRVLEGESSPLEGRREVNVVVLQTDDQPFGLIVDEIQDTEEIVVKPLGDLLREIEAYSGATVQGDGKVALILDVNGLAALSKASEAVEADLAVHEEVQDLSEEEELETLLVIGSEGGGRMAIPLSSVARLEEFRLEDVEQAGPVALIQYRNSIIPLLYVKQLLDMKHEGGAAEGAQHRVSVEFPQRARLQAVVYQAEGFSAGIVVDEILDIVEARLSVLGPGTRPGVPRTSVVQGRVTEIIDAEWLLNSGSRAVQKGEAS